jgi:hypothetical protein
MDDIAMKMQDAGPAFVDGLYAKFYSLSNEPLRVGPKCNGSSVRPDSFHPAKAVAGREEQPAFPSGSPIVPAHAPLEKE